MRIAVLALQGAFVEHEAMLRQLGVDSFEVRQLSDWQQPKDGLIIPGGESTTQSKLLHDLGLLQPIREAIVGGLPVFGTCAGLILLAKSVEGENRERLATMDICVKRNAYGRQLGSFSTEAPFASVGDIPMTFIRAPYIEKVEASARGLGCCRRPHCGCPPRLSAGHSLPSGAQRRPPGPRIFPFDDQTPIGH